MLTHDLILNAAEQVITRSHEPIGPAFIQRHSRVGYVTASHLVLALADIGVLGAPNGSARREVLLREFDPDAALAAIDQAAAADRFILDCEPCRSCRALQKAAALPAGQHTPPSAGSGT